MRKLRELNPKDFTLVIVMVAYFVALGAVLTLGALDTAISTSTRDVRHRVSAEPPRVSVRVSGESTATVEQTTTCEIRVSVDSKDTTATGVSVSNMMSAFGGATVDLIESKPKFESTEATYGNGVKVNWGTLQLVGGEKLSIKLKFKSKKRGVISSIASVRLDSDKALNSNSFATLIAEPVAVAQLTSATTLPRTVTTLPGTALSQLLGKSKTGLPGSALVMPPTAGKQSGPATTPSGPLIKKTTPAPRATTPPATVAKNTTTTKKATPSTTAARKQSPSTTSAAPPPPKRSASGLVDVSKGDWFATCVNSMVRQGIVTGYPDNTFKPNALVSKAEFVSMVVRASGSAQSGTEPFSDVNKGDWYYPAVAAASSKGWLSEPASSRFAPNAKMTRELAAVISVKAAGVSVGTGAEEIDGWLQGFSDRTRISSWARPYVAASVKYNLITGYPDNRFAPGNAITRAQACTLIYRIFFETPPALHAFPDFVPAG